MDFPWDVPVEKHASPSPPAPSAASPPAIAAAAVPRTATRPPGARDMGNGPFRKLGKPWENVGETLENPGKT